MGRGGIRDILIANPLVGQRRMDRLVELRKVSLSVESSSVRLLIPVDQPV